VTCSMCERRQNVSVRTVDFVPLAELAKSALGNGCDVSDPYTRQRAE
jgi:hypothetical protein